MKYQVKVDYKRFLFEDSDIAIDYAKLSKMSAVGSVDVAIELVEEEEPTEEA